MGFLSINEVAERLSVSRDVVSGLVRDGELPALRVGPRLVRINEMDLSSFVRRNMVRSSDDILQQALANETEGQAG